MAGIGAEPYTPKDNNRENMPCSVKGCKGHLVQKTRINNKPIVDLYQCDTCNKRYYINEGK